MASTIGIKIANGEFYPLVEENSQVKKRLVLTTVHDKQRSVQIDLYKSFTKTMADALYIGSLVVEKIKPRAKGEPSIEMVITSTKEGNITAEAIDLDSSPQGEHHYLNVSLKSMDDDNRDFEIPDFELEQNEQPPSGLYEKARAAKQKEASGTPWPVLIIAAAAALIIIGAVVWYFLLRDKAPGISQGRPPAAIQDQPSSRPVREEPQNTAGGTPDQPAGSVPAAGQNQTARPGGEANQPGPGSAGTSSGSGTTPSKDPASTPVIEAPAAAPASTAQRRNRPAPPVASYKVPAVIPREGALYRIRWGDTLWDISEAFYRNPWLYPRIARFNNIRNPDRIISGTTIRIPPRN